MAKNLSYIFGIVMVLLGIAGFFYDPIFGLFKVGTIHNVIYIVLGLILLVMAPKNAVMGAKTVGIIALIVSVLGFIPSTDSVLGLVETNVNSSILQAVVAVVLLYAGFTGEKVSPQLKPQNEQPNEQQNNFNEPQQPQM